MAGFFQSLPLGTQIRKSAVAVLLGQATIAGLAIFDTPLDALPAGTDVAVNVYSSERRDTISAAGGRPGFRVAYTLNIQCVFVSALADEAILQSDILKQQILDALFEDPSWPSQIEAIGTVEEQREHKFDGERYRIEHMLAIAASWRESYGARTTTPLTPGAAPGQGQAVMQPLTKIVTGIVAGTAPGPGGVGSEQTIFTIDTIVPTA